MNNPLGRKMFRQAGMSKQPMGILASSPELMGAVKGYNLGGVEGRRAQRQNNPTGFSLSDFFINPAGAASPSGQNKRFTVPTDDNNQQISDMSQENAIIPTNPAFINEANKKIIEEKTEEKAEDFDAKKLMPFGTNLGIRGETTSSMAEDSQLINAKNAINESMGRVANARTKNFRDVEIAGSTYNEAIKDVTDQLNKKGKEVGLDDVYDEGMKLLGYDPKKLDEQFDADKRQAFWFNLINAGLQVAAGQSSNALTNLANGLGKGLQSFGKDVGELKADLREDRKEATNVMYRLLNNKRSEQLAKEALELDKKMKVFQIVQSEVGERKNDALKAAEFDFEKKKFNLNYLIELKKFDQAEKLSDNKIKASLKAAIINNKTISTPFMLGLIEPKEGYTMDTVDISDMNTYKFSQDGIDMAKDIADNTRTYRKTDPEREIANNKGKKVAAVGVVFDDDGKNNDGTFQQKWDKNIQKDWVKDAKERPDFAGETLLNQVRQYADQGAKIDISKIPYVDVRKYFTSNAIDMETGLEKPNSAPIKLFPNLFKKETIDLSQGKS